MKKKITAILLAALLLMSLAACGTKTETPAESPAAEAPAAETPSEAPAEEPAEEPAAETYTVGIIQQLEHPALDAATEGFKQALTDELGDAVTFEYDNAQNDPNNCTTIANKYVSDQVDLIMANATTALQSAASATGDIPIVGTSITDYDKAGVLLGTADAPGGNVTGACDLAPLDQQADLLTEICPEAKTVGIVYCSAEANSIYQAEKMTVYLQDKGLDVKEYTVADSNEIQSVLTSAVEEIDAIYIPTDNTLADNMELVKNITVTSGTPVITGEENMCKNGGLATLSISYYDMGYSAGVLAASILRGEAEPATSPIVYSTNAVKKYNAEIAQLLNITMPEGIEAIAE